MEWNPIQLCDPQTEERCGYTVTQEVKSLWNIELNLAKALLDVCKKHNLRISVSFGSMIGAVRHQGFVPWDDDMDFYMPREDYDKLNDLADEEFNNGGPVVLRSYKHDRHYYKLSLTRICLEGTAFLSHLQSFMGFEYDQSIAIDVFPVDRMPEDEIERDNLIKEYINLAQYMELRHYWRERLWRGRAEFIKYKKLAGDKASWSDEEIYAYLMQKFREVPRTTSKCAYIATYLRSEACARLDNFIDDEIIEVPFERTTVPCYVSYDKILTRYFGDWRTPVQYPNDHESYKKNSFIIDLYNPYKNYLKSSIYFFREYIGHECGELLKLVINIKHIWKLNFLLARYRNKKVVLWGASVFLNNIILDGKVRDYGNLIGIVDRVETQRGKRIGSYMNYGLSDLTRINPDVIIVTIVNHKKRFMPEIETYLKIKKLSPRLFVI